MIARFSKVRLLAVYKVPVYLGSFQRIGGLESSLAAPALKSTANASP
jgi:hypothetical protein